MSDEAFTQGVKLGGIFKQSDVKLIICYMLTNISTGLTKDAVVDVLQKNSIANYFEVANAFSELISQKHIVCCNEEEKLFTTTDSGRMVSEQLDVSLSYSLREKVVKESLKLLEKIKREKENTVEVIRIDNGYMVKCIVSGTNVNLMELSLYAPDMMQANLIKESFLEKPSDFYTAVLEQAALL